MMESEIREIQAAFVVESSELLAEMESALLALETSMGDAEEFSRLFRAVHTVKGSAGIVEFEALEGFCHEVEHVLVRIREREMPLGHSLVSLLLSCHDHIRGMVSAYAGSAGRQTPLFSPDHDALLARLAATHTTAMATPTSFTEPVASVCDEGIATPGQDPTPGPEDRVADVPLSPAGDDGVDEQASPQQSIPSPSRSDQRTVRVDAARVEQLADLITELVTASSALEADVRRLGDAHCMESSAQVASLVKQLQERSMIFRMVPVKTLFQRFQRIVHDGKHLGKEIRLVISGGDTELDKVVAEKLYDPMLHLIRNAVDHGIETAAERVLKNKPALGTIHVQAGHDQGSIVITISDDGQGLDLATIARKATQAGLLGRDATPSDRDILHSIFEPGFSTLDSATRLSGRGVGLDVVKKSLEALRGHMEVKTGDGTGTTFVLRIPLSLSLVDGFMVTLGTSLFIVQLEQVQEVLELPDIHRPGVLTNGCLQLREELLPCLDLAGLLGISRKVPPKRNVVVMRHDGQSVGLIVDELLGETKAIIKPLGPLLRGRAYVSGASILGDGSIALFLETEKIISRLG